MPREFYRSQRVSQQLHRSLSEIVQREVKDPRVGFVTLTAVEVSRDIKYAKVYFSLLDESADAEKARQALQGAAGFLRGLLARELTIRSVPELTFVHDNSVREGQRMSALINSAIEADNSNARSSDSADSSGDFDERESGDASTPTDQ